MGNYNNCCGTRNDQNQENDDAITMQKNVVRQSEHCKLVKKLTMFDEEDQEIIERKRYGKRVRCLSN